MSRAHRRRWTCVAHSSYGRIRKDDSAAAPPGPCTRAVSENNWNS